MFLYCFECVKYSTKINCTQYVGLCGVIYFIDVLIFSFVYLGLGFILVCCFLAHDGWLI